MAVKLTNKASISSVIAQMTLEEKVTLLVGETMFKSPAMEKYGIPSVYYLDGGTGANYMQMFMDVHTRMYKDQIKDAEALLFDAAEEGGEASIGGMAMYIDMANDPERAANATPEQREMLNRYLEMMKEYLPEGKLPGCFPPGMLFGATWDQENIYNAGLALGKEADYFNIDVLLGTPNVNIHRDPLNGRLFEGYSEDPCLVSKLAPSFVRGIQDTGVIANVKHFAANNQETDRRTVNEMIPERALHEIYFPGFKACVQDGGCKTVMSAYNAINGTFCAMNKWLLTDMLRDEWGFDGFVVSDWTAAYDQVEAYRAGNDMDMPGPRAIDKVVAAVKAGELDEAVLDRALERVLNIVLEMPVMKGHRYTSLDREGSRRAAYESAKEGIVLLKNNGVLPLKKEGKLAFYGDRSKKFVDCGGGSANVITDQTSSMYDCSEKILGKGNVSFETISDDAQAVVVTVGANGQEGFDRSAMEIDFSDRAVLQKAIADAKAANKKIVVVLNICGPVDMTGFEADVDAIICVFLPGMEGGRAAADVLFGKINPSGKLPLTFPKHYCDTPTYGNFPGRANEVWYGEGIFVGYRYYDMRKVEPMYPFGYGLSYTKFKIDDAKLSSNRMDLDKDEKLCLSCKVRNLGDLDGKEVVQVYIGQKNPTLVKPVRELKAFKKVFVPAGGEVEVRFEISAEELKSWDNLTRGWFAEPDTYTIYLGNSSRDFSAELEFEAVGYNPMGFNGKTTMLKLAATPGALETFLAHCPGNVISREAIELSILFEASNTLEHFWRTTVSKALAPLNLTQDEIDARYKALLTDINRFH